MENDRRGHPQPGAPARLPRSPRRHVRADLDAAAPWHVVPAEYKWFARLAVAKTAVKALGKGLALGPPPLDPEVVKAAESLSRKEMAALDLAEPKPTKG